MGKQGKSLINRRHKYVLHAIQIIGTISLLFFVFWNFDWAAFLKLIPKITIWFYVYSFGLVFMGQLLYIWRWKFVLGAMGLSVSFEKLSVQYFIAIFFNNFLPGGIGGDISRSYYLGRTAGYLNVGTSVLGDRIVGLFSLVILSILMIPSLGLNSPALAGMKDLLVTIFSGFIFIFLVILFSPARFLIRRISWLYRHSENVSERLMRLFMQIRSIIKKPTVLVASMGVSFFYLMIITICYRDFFCKTAGIEYPFWAIMSTLTVIAILLCIPITINGIGLREQLHYFLFANIGLPREVSVSISLLMFAHFLILSLLGFFLWLNARRSAE